MTALFDFGYVRELVQNHAGIVIDSGKEYLARSRLLPIVEQEGLDSLAALVKELRARSWSDLHRRVVEAMATTETTFFRDPAVFEAIKTRIIPDLLKAREHDRTLTICSAACASGQEVYSLVMVLYECFPEVLERWEVRVLGLDLSLQMLMRARAGQYSVLEMSRGLPARMMTKYFQRDGMGWQVKPQLRAPIEFRQANFLRDRIAGPIDLLMMRNVLMYFDEATKQRILEMASQALRPDGTLIIGATESILSGDRFKRQTVNGATYYQPSPTNPQFKWKSKNRISST